MLPGQLTGTPDRGQTPTGRRASAHPYMQTSPIFLTRLEETFLLLLENLAAVPEAAQKWA